MLGLRLRGVHRCIDNRLVKVKGVKTLMCFETVFVGSANSI